MSGKERDGENQRDTPPKYHHLKIKPKKPTAIQTSNIFFSNQAVKVDGTFDTGSIFLFWKQPGSPSC